MLLFDTIAYSNRLRRRHPMEKVLFSIGLLAACLLLPPWPACGLVWLTTSLAAVFVARIPPRALLKATLLPVAFLATGAIPLVLSLRLGGAGGPRLAVGDGGVAAALIASLRAMGAQSCLLFLGMTTPVPELILLARSWRVPAALVETSLVVYNMLCVLLVACREMLVAQGARLGYSSTRNAYRSQSMLWSCLFLKSLSRARRLEVGLASRGYQGDLRVVSGSSPPSVTGLLAAAGAVAAVAVLSVLLA